MFFGVTAIAAPAEILGLKGSTHPFYPAIINGLDHYSLLTFFFQSFAGMALGMLNPSRSWRWGLAMMVPFPILAFIDIANGLESHRLWPIEIVTYAVLAVLCIGAAHLGSYMRLKFSKHVVEQDGPGK